MAISLRVIGREMTTAEEQAQLLGSTFHRVEKDRAVAVGADRDDATVVEIPDAEPTDLVELHLDDGSVVVTTYEKLREWVDESPGERGAEPGWIPAVLPMGEGERGMGTVVLKVLRVFRVKPVEGIANLATREAIRVIEGQLGGRPGLYRLTAQGELGELISAPLPAGDKPLLIFLHGTASSTRGSFGGLFAETAEWRDLRARYGNRIFALEHRTLSESPAANALELARLLPAKAELHLVSHSRGGLIGEFLCRGGFDAEDLKVFLRGRPKQQAGEELEILTALGGELAAKSFRIERFVRVACPAAGTVLASDRLDIYLSVLLNVLERALPPGASSIAELLKAVLLEVARRRADPKELPGLEAQRPDSPYIHFLNRNEQAVDHDLTAIAGDLKGGSLLQSLRALAGYSFFWQKNDLVVHTRAMYGGLPRENGGWVSYHEGPAVTHFSYFREKTSRERLAAALLRDKRETQPEGFSPLKEELETRSFSPWRDGATRPQGTVLFLPDVFSSALHANGAAVWLSAAAIGKGELGTLGITAPGVSVGELVDGQALQPLENALAGLRKIVAVPYDWRGGIKEAAKALRARLQQLTEADKPVTVVAHGLGALGVLELLSQPPSDSGADPLQGARALLLAPPLGGSEAILRFALADGPLFNMLKLLDQSRTESEVLRLFLRMQGLAELLPDRALDPAWWKALTAPKPPVPLPEIARRRTALKAALGHPSLDFLFGAAEETTTLTFTDEGRRKAVSRRDGDGWMINPAETPAERTWFTASVHERLSLDASAAAVVADLILAGATARAGRQSPDAKARREPVPLLFPSQRDLVAELTAADAAAETGKESVLRVRVVHGSLDRLGIPVAVGHYTGDAIGGSEAFLDRCLEGRLRRRHLLGDYPGPAGTAAYVSAPGFRPPGALVVGLGEMGELTGGVLSLGVERAVIQRALFEIDRAQAEVNAAEKHVPLPIAFLLIGTRGGGQLSVRQSIAAIVRGVLHARRALQQAELDHCVAIDEIFFIELWSDIAIAAGHALQKLPQDPSLGLLPGERIDPAPTLMTVEGGRGNSRAYADEWSWWRRIIVTDEKGEKGPGGLKFVTLSERSRAEERLIFSHLSLVDDLLETAPQTISSEVGEGSVVNTLFELLLPVPIKESIFDGTDLVLVVDPQSGRYPWELLAQRRGEEIEPLVSRIRLLRQFRTSDFREAIAPARTDYALVVGDPDPANTGLAPLESARQEAGDVVKELERGGFSVEPSLGDGGRQIIQKLFLREYRILHIAAHGDYRPDEPGQSGVVIGRNKDGSRSVLSAAVFKQLRAIPEVVFLNCCHLGKFGATPARNGLTSDVERTQLAASVANAIMGLGVRCLVVAGWAVNDRAAREFAQEFYRRLLAGETFGDAVHAGRLAVWRKYKHTTTWGAYQCYGDPAFRLRRPRKRPKETSAPSFVSPLEVAGELSDISAEASNAGTSEGQRAALRQKLQMIERFLESQPKWKEDGEVLNQLAEAWKAAGDRGKAIDFYREALTAWDAKAPLKAAEQIANLIDRQNRAAGDAALPWPALTPLEIAAGENQKRPGAWLDWVDQLAVTPERAALRGGMLKRQAENATGEDRKQLLASAAKAYLQGVELHRQKTGSVHYYHALNAVALAWATGSADQGTLEELIKESRRSAEEERAREGERLWSALADCEADLLEALLHGELDRKAEEITGTFKKRLATLGTPTEQDSAMAQVRFLLSCATDEREAFKEPLKIIAEAFSGPKE